MTKNLSSPLFLQTTIKFFKSTYGLILLSFSLLLLIPDPIGKMKDKTFLFFYIVFNFNLICRVPLILYFRKNFSKIEWDIRNKYFQKIFYTIITLGILSGLSIGSMAVGVMLEYGLHSISSSIMMVIVAGVVLLGAHNFSFTKATVVAYIASILLPVMIFVGSKLSTEFLAYFFVLLLYAILSVNQIFSERQTTLKNSEMTEFYQTQTQYYKSILESVPGLVAIFTSHLEYEMINSKVTEYTGLTENDLIGHKLGFSKNTPIFEQAVFDFKNSYLTQTQVKLKLKGISEEKWFLMALHKIKSTGQITVISIDINAQVEAEEKSLEQRAIVETSARMAAIGQLAAGIAHEINNPLTVITSKADQLLRRMKNVDEKTISDMGKIQTTAFRIANIVKGMKALSRDGEKDPLLDCKAEDVLKDISILFEEKIRTHQIQFSKSIEPGLTFECRSTQLSQVVMNLISNSIDAIQNLQEKWIHVEAQKVDQKIMISVTDSGSGIPKEILEKLMTPFFTTKPAGIGTGLGLSISKRIISDHNGVFYYDSNSSHTRFVIKIPLKNSQKKVA